MLSQNLSLLPFLCLYILFSFDRCSPSFPHLHLPFLSSPPFIFAFTLPNASPWFFFLSAPPLSLSCLNYRFLPLLHDFFTTAFPILSSLSCLSHQQTKHPSLNPASFSSLLFPLCFVNYFYPIFCQYIDIR